jgi:hypothetical protein
MAQVSSCVTPREVWKLLEQTYASRSKARVVNKRMALAITQKGNMSISKYLTKMKSSADDMASAGKALEEEELFHTSWWDSTSTTTRSSSLLWLVWSQFLLENYTINS